jgi:predicted metal-binding membrane protein
MHSKLSSELASSPPPERVGGALWHHPEWWSLMLSAVAWVAIVREHWNAAPACHAASATWGSRVASWSLMTIAMMLPMIVPAIRAVARNSRMARDRAIAVFLLGYLAPWLVIGMALSLTAATTRWGGAAGFAAASVWQLTAAKRYALDVCRHTAPIATEGGLASRDCGALGWQTGIRCVASCWALMLTCFLAGHTLFSLLAVTGVSAGERYLANADQRLLSAALMTAAVVHLISS